MKIARLAITALTTLLSALLSAFFQDWSFVLVGLLLSTILIVVLFKPKIFSKKLFVIQNPNEHSVYLKKFRFSFKNVKFDLSGIKILSEETITFAAGVSIFTIIAYFYYQTSNSKNFFYNFFSSSLHFFSSNVEFLFIVPGLLLLFVLLVIKGKSKISRPKLVGALVIIVVSYFVSLIALTIIGFVHILMLSVNSELGGMKGVIKDPIKINEYLSKTNTIPHIILVDKSTNKDLIIASIAEKSEDRLYVKTILPIVPNEVYSLIKTPDVPIYFINNLLVVREVNPEIMEILSPSLGRAVVRLSLSEKNIKSEPKVDVLNRQEYLKFREDQINEKIESMQVLIDEVDTYINRNYSAISEARRKIQANKDIAEDTVIEKDQDYNNCKTAGSYSYYFGFYRYYTDAQCEARRQQWDVLIAQYQQNIADWEQTLKTAQYYLSQNQEIKETLVAYQRLIELSKDSTPYELGLFLPEREIKIALDTTRKDYLKEYMATLIHEYMHYTSYVSEERRLEHSLEEGLTEYFARKIMNKNFGDYNQLGYPVMVKLIEEISKKIDEDELLTIYFTKDQERLVALLNDEYGDKFYSDTEFYFRTIGYLGAEEQLKVGNNILERMGGNTISMEDLK